MKNYVVKYAGTDEHKVINKGNFSFVFDKTNNYILDLVEVVEKHGNYPKGREFDTALKKLYVHVIDSCECVPYLTIDSAKEMLINIRDNKVLGDLRLELKKSVDSLSIELEDKVRDERSRHSHEERKLRKKLEDEINEAMNQADMQRSLWKDNKEVIEKEDNEISKIKLEESLKDQYQKIMLQEGKWQRLNGTKERKILDLQEKQIAKIQSMRELYFGIIEDKKKEYKEKINKLVSEMEADKLIELDLIQEILDKKYKTIREKKEEDKK